MRNVTCTIHAQVHCWQGSSWNEQSPQIKSSLGISGIRLNDALQGNNKYLSPSALQPISSRLCQSIDIKLGIGRYHVAAATASLSSSLWGESPRELSRRISSVCRVQNINIINFIYGDFVANDYSRVSGRDLVARGPAHSRQAERRRTDIGRVAMIISEITTHFKIFSALQPNSKWFVVLISE